MFLSLLYIRNETFIYKKIPKGAKLILLKCFFGWNAVNCFERNGMIKELQAFQYVNYFMFDTK